MTGEPKPKTDTHDNEDAMCVCVWWRATPLWCLLLDLQTRHSNLQVDQSHLWFLLFAFLLRPLHTIINPNTRWERSHTKTRLSSAQKQHLTNEPRDHRVDVWFGTLDDKGVWFIYVTSHRTFSNIRGERWMIAFPVHTQAQDEKKVQTVVGHKVHLDKYY